MNQTSNLPKALARSVATVALLLVAQASSALSIEWQYDLDTNNFFAPGSTARNTLETAGAWYESNIQDTLSEITPATLGSGLLGPTNFQATFRNPSLVNGAGTDLVDHVVEFLNVAQNTLKIWVGATDLPYLNTLAAAEPGRVSVALLAPGTIRDNAVSRGQGASGAFLDIFNADDVTNQTANDFALWGGMITIDTTFNWHTDVNLLPTGSSFDLYSILLHEIGHVLGVGTSDIWDNQVAGNTFVGPNATQEFGAATVPLDGFLGTNSGNHWKNSDVGLSPVASGFAGVTGGLGGVLQETAFDPTPNTGQRKFLTELDLAGLRDVGWQVVPVPAAVWLFGSASLVLLVRRRPRMARGSPAASRLTAHR
jgi:hypothetical protein